MENSIKVTQTLLMKKKEKIQELSAIESKLKSNNEVISRENQVFDEENSRLMDKKTELKGKIEELEQKMGILLEDYKIYSSEVSAMQEFRSKEINEVSKIYKEIDKRLEELKVNTQKAINESDRLHNESIEEQKKISRDRRDLDIYKERLQKNYDEAGLGKIILKE